VENTDSDFITLFAAFLNQDNNSLMFCNAGHNPPFIVTKDGRIKDIKDGETFLGFEKKQVYVEREIQLNPGDVFVLYTDGFTEGENAGKEQYGETRLKETVKANRHLSSREIEKSVVNSFERFIDPDFQLDDRTLIILKID
jgi:sigma-B regulation protein RsbU (phosphoserine phosphatase)